MGDVGAGGGSRLRHPLAAVRNYWASGGVAGSAQRTPIRERARPAPTGLLQEERRGIGVYHRTSRLQEGASACGTQDRALGAIIGAMQHHQGSIGITTRSGLVLGGAAAHRPPDGSRDAQVCPWVLSVCYMYLSG